MTLQDLLTLSLPERIIWLHGDDGPKGKMSHDTLAAELGTTRQTVINWEKRGGIEPGPKYREKLAEFSGYPAGAFSRREAEAMAEETFGHLLLRLRDEADVNSRTLERVLTALSDANIVVPDQQQEPRSDSTAPDASQGP